MKHNKKFPLAGLALLTAIAGGCKEERQDAQASQPTAPSIELKVSEQIHHTTNRDRLSLTYCGMPNKQTFSLSQAYDDSVNYYYPADAKEITFYNFKFVIEEVTPERIKLKKK